MNNSLLGGIVSIFICSAMLLPYSAAAQSESGNPEDAKAKIPLCQGCHGINGEGMTMPPGQPSAPRLAGQIAVYFSKALNDYKNDARVEPMMNAITKGLTDSDIANLAAYYSSLK
jgi:cytochrome c553